MPRWNQVLPETVAKIKADLAGGDLTYAQIAARYKVHKSTVQKIKSGTHAGSSTPVATKADPKHAEALALRAQGMSRDEIAKKLGVLKSWVDYHLYSKPARERAKNGNGAAPHRIISVLGKNGRALNPETAKLQAKVNKLKAQGLGLSAIAQKLGETKTRVNYYFYNDAYRRNREAHSTQKSTEGVNTNGHTQLDTRFLIGYGCAELDRTLTAVAQRLGIATGVLRQGFSRFLGSSSLRS